MRSSHSSPHSVDFNSTLNMDITEEISPEDAAGVELDNAIASLQEQIASLKDQRRLQTATILSSQTSKSILSNLRKPSSKITSSHSTAPTDSDPLLAKSAAQTTHNLENLYRACASVTSFQVQDPDPNAVDNGHVLGLRIDVSNAGKFVRPYYIMLNKPYSGSAALRIHRHTVPPCIPLASLAAKYLPAPKTGEGITKEKRQDLTTFARKVRREITGYHLRIASIKHLRKGFSLDEKLSRKGKEREREIADISAADAEAKQVRIEWVDGKIGRCIVGMNGEVVKCVIIGEDGRDRETERRILGGDKRMEGIADRLMEGIY
ncbi:03e2af57-8c9b-4a02-a0c8-be3b4685f6af [Sclerotinia trifoliorum]|uniref:03e2af57-8c9b-4a02-a0c8-be3b4685f6af n=1 Tax=Sclerotinia trifoliorum TaxID=28548 RepID=A0A8H2ZRM1_9HELO|nr:03e2af57-8c9b-4a02-a0c8-be3b4685f6af [Sclerotinia trifoliorum]